MNAFHEGFLVLRTNHSETYVGIFKLENLLGFSNGAGLWAAVICSVLAQLWPSALTSSISALGRAQTNRQPQWGPCAGGEGKVGGEQCLVSCAFWP